MTTEMVQPDIFATGLVNADVCSKSKVGGGRFALNKILGRGGMGVVWLARDEPLATDVALKFLPPQIRFDSVALDDLRRETARSRKLTHPNIIRIHDFYEGNKEEAFISMEYVDGPNLSSLRVAEPKRIFSWEFLRPLMKQLCEALEYAHGERIIHRDLKPANLMLDSRSRLKLADFGIARTISDTMSRASMSPGTSGTLLYMSPQQLDGRIPRVTDDTYALGATIYELLTSKPPFFTGDLLHQIRNVPPMPLTERLAELEIDNPIPREVEQTIMACLAKDETKRPQTARNVAIRLGLVSRELQNKPGLLLRKKTFVIGAALTGVLVFTSSFLTSSRKVASPEKFAPLLQTKPVALETSPVQSAPIQTAPAPSQSAPAPSQSAPVPSVELSAVPVPESAVTRTNNDNPTALQLVQLGNQYVSDRSKDKVVEVISRKSVGDLHPKSWHISYYDPQATFKAVEVYFEEGKMTRVREPARVLEIFSSGAQKLLALNKVKIDSDTALKKVLALPALENIPIIGAEMKLERGYGGVPVWVVELFRSSRSRLSNDESAGCVVLLAEDGQVLKNTITGDREEKKRTFTNEDNSHRY